jgi:beta-glucosidase-like glycosyl hydrolase
MRKLVTVKRVRYAQGVTAFPAGITTGSTWDTGLMYARGYAIGTSITMVQDYVY